jgi:hypothetical protein
MKPCRGSGSIAPLILNLGTRWRWVVSLTSQLLEGLECESWNPPTHWIGNWVGARAVWTFWEREKCSAAYRFWTLFHPTCSLIDLLITLSGLQHCSGYLKLSVSRLHCGGKIFTAVPQQLTTELCCLGMWLFKTGHQKGHSSQQNANLSYLASCPCYRLGRC